VDREIVVKVDVEEMKVERDRGMVVVRKGSEGGLSRRLLTGR